MKKVLYLSLVTCSIISMQLSTIKTANKFKEKLIQYNHTKLNKFKEKIVNHHPNNTKQPTKLSLDDIKQPIQSSSVFAPKQLGSIELYHDKNGFHVLHNNEMHYVQKCFTDPIVRNITPQQIKDFQKVGKGYLSINQMSNGEFSLEIKKRLRGGGPIGATIGVFLGKAAVSLAGHGAIQVIGLLTGPAYIPTVIALEACFGAAIESASMAGAIAGGITLGAATGPV